MDRAHEKVVEAQFGPRAQAYVESAVHAGGADLEALEAIVRDRRPARALDLGAGGGHVSYLMARHAGTVTASDLSRDMLDAVAAAARDPRSWQYRDGPGAGRAFAVRRRAFRFSRLPLFGASLA